MGNNREGEVGFLDQCRAHLLLLLLCQQTHLQRRFSRLIWLSKATLFSMAKLSPQCSFPLFWFSSSLTRQFLDLSKFGDDQVLWSVCEDVKDCSVARLGDGWTIPTTKVYLSKWQNVFVQMEKCICPNGKMYLSKWQHVLVQIAKYIFLKGKIYFSKWQN